MAPRLVHRARYRRCWMQPAELPLLAAEESFVLSGVSLSERIGAGLVIGDEIEGYVSAEEVKLLVQKYSLIDFARRPNVTVHVVGSWPFIAGLKEVPAPVAVLDLLESGDERTRDAGRQLVERLGMFGPK
ncbi:MAG: hypothetical protein M1358_00600 [Chloroflexi bacterium]|nr:hypothetical protein [Chloroflexota bacterium]